MQSENRLSVGIVISHIILVFGASIMLIPFIWMFLTSFKTFAETMHIPIIWFPAKFSLMNYTDVLQRLNFGKYYVNTIIVATTITLGQMFLCSLAAYSFGRLEFPGRDAMFFLILSVLMIPAQMTLIPSYLLMNTFGWVNTFWALIIPNLPSAYGTFFLRQFFKTLPRDLEDAAKIDGCSYFRIYWNILLPLCGSAFVAFGIFTILWAWNDLLWPLIITSSDQKRLLSVGIATLVGQHSTEYQKLMAASVMATAPMIVVFIIGQKYFISGIAVTGIKA